MTNSGNFAALPDRAAYGLIAAVLIGFVLGLVFLRRNLGTWNLGQALSEDQEMTVILASGASATQTQMVASSSRLIAFLGTLGMVPLFLGFGVVALWNFAKTGTVPDELMKVGQYMVDGLTLFAPYAVNKMAGVLGGK